MNRRELFSQALDECRKKLVSDPEFIPLQSIEGQLKYLRDLEEGRNSDRAQLAKISIGLIAAREIENYDMKFAELLYKVIEEVDAMRFGR